MGFVESAHGWSQAEQVVSPQLGSYLLNQHPSNIAVTQHSSRKACAHQCARRGLSSLAFVSLVDHALPLLVRAMRGPANLPLFDPRPVRQYFDIAQHRPHLV